MTKDEFLGICALEDIPVKVETVAGRECISCVNWGSISGLRNTYYYDHINRLLTEKDVHGRMHSRWTACSPDTVLKRYRTMTHGYRPIPKIP